METSYNLSPMPQLRQLLPNTPWQLSPNTFQKVQKAGSKDGYRKYEITSNDPEWAFILRYFEWQRPTNRCIKKVHCIHSPEMTQQFQSTLAIIEKEAKNPAFAPKWRQEENTNLRQKVHQRWKTMTDPYSPVTLEGNGRKEYFTNTKILPLWHGTKKEICHSICQSGFTFFGKQDLIQGKKDQNTDLGYFGSGIYFTNSPRYASEIYSDGNLLLAWVCMREPYPVVADAPRLYPDKPKDMVKLEGFGAYQNYNAHHIPIISVQPSNPNCAVYYPCSDNEEPLCDEIVVFQKSQTLTRFWIEIEIEISKLLEAKPTIGIFLEKVLDLLENQAVKKNLSLTQALEEKADALIVLDPNQTVPENDAEFCRWAMQLLDQSGEVRVFVSKRLLTPQISPQPSQNKNSDAKFLSNSITQMHIQESSYASQGQQQIQPKILQQPPYNLIFSPNSFINDSFQQIEPQKAEPNISSSQQIKLEIAQKPLSKKFSIDPVLIKELRTLQGHSEEVSALIQLSDGTLASGSVDNTIKLWDPKTGKCLKTLQGHSGEVYSLIQLSDGTLASGSRDKTIKFWDPKTGKVLEYLQGHLGEVDSLIQLSDGTLASGSFDRNLASGSVDNTINRWAIKLWDPKTGKCLKTLQGHSGDHSLIQLSNGTLASFGSLDDTIKLRDPKTGKVLEYLQGHSAPVHALIQLSDGTLASGSYDNTIKLWDPRTGKCLKTLQGHSEEVSALIQLSDGTLASGSVDNTIKLWDPKIGNCLKTLQGHSAVVHDLIQLSDGTLASGSCDKNIKLWDPKTGKCLKTLQGHSNFVLALIQLSDGTLASGSGDKTIKIWG